MIFSPLLHDMVLDMLSGIVTPETIAIDLNQNNKDLPKSEKTFRIFLNAGRNIVGKNL